MQHTLRTQYVVIKGVMFLFKMVQTSIDLFVDEVSHQNNLRSIQREKS